MTSWSSLLRDELGALNVELSEGQFQGMTDYLAILHHWNETINLTGLAPRARVRRLVVEPLWLAAQLRPWGGYLDIGSGNGSPAVPWRLCHPFSTVSLVESRSRRAVFLGVLARKLGIESLRVHHMRFEAYCEESVSINWVTLQGVRLDRKLMDLIWLRCPDSQIVWLTRNPVLPAVPEARIQIPGSDREAIVFGVRKAVPEGLGLPPSP